MNLVSQNFVASGNVNYINAYAGVEYTDISSGVRYVQTAVPYGNRWKVKQAGQVFVPSTSGGGVSSVGASLPLASSGGATPVISLPAASVSQDGYLKKEDWNTFNSKQGALGYTPENASNKVTTLVGANNTTYPTSLAVLTAIAASGGVPPSRTIATNAPLSGGGDLSANRTLSIAQATTSTDGYLSSTDWNTFNNKQAALGYTPENVSNKATDLTSPDNTKYPTTLAVSTAIAAIPSGVPTTRTISTTAPLSGGGDLSANRTITISQATTSTDGYLSSTDWNTFNNKQAALGFTPVTNARTISTTAPLAGGGDLSANRTLTIAQATTSTDGYLSSTDWNTFNNKRSIFLVKRSGRLYGANANAGATSTVAIVTGTIYYIPFQVDGTFSLNAFTINLTANTSVTAINMGIYNADANANPTTLVVSTGSFAVAGTGAKSSSVAATQLTTGLYILAVQFNGAGTVAAYAAAQLSNYYGLPASLVASGIGLTFAQAYGAFPSSPSCTIATSAQPAVLYTVV